MIVSIGSTNPIKVYATEHVFKRYFGMVSVKPVEVDLDIPRQPIGLDAVLDGAYKRAKYAVSNVKNSSYGVGIEAGLIEFPYTISGYLNIQACIIIDKYGRYSLGLSPGFEIPVRFVEKLIQEPGIELETLAEDLTGVENIGEKGGIISYLTREAVSRIDLTIQAVTMALIPFINTGLYDIQKL